MKISDKYNFFYNKDIEIASKVIKKEKLDVISEYEDKLADFFKAKYSVALNSGTSAIQSALFALNVKKGDEVILSPVCPIMSVVPILSLGATPIFCDTYENNFGLNIDDLKKAISGKTKAVIEVPMWGYPTDVKRLKRYLKKENIPLVLDLAQSHCTKLGSNFLSDYGDISCFSTHDRKILPTGEGGFTLTNNKKHCKKMQSYIKFGNMDGVKFGLNFKMGAVQAGIGLNRIEHIPDQIKKRRENAKYLLEKINNKKIKEFNIIEQGKPNYYSLLLESKKGKGGELIEYLDKNGIPSDIKRYNFKALYKYPLFKKYRRACKKAELLSQSITTVPIHPGLGKNELDYMAKVINNF